MTYSLLSTITLAGAYSTALGTAQDKDRATRHDKTKTEHKPLNAPRALSRWATQLPVFASTVRS
jgi:hypothetical protein